MSGWKGSTRRDRLPANWHILREQALTRDGYQCQHVREDTMRVCALEANEVDHIEAMTDDHRLEAIQSLCTYHHGQKSGAEGGRASGVVRQRKAAAAKPKHPGLSTAPAAPAQQKAPTPEGPAPF